MDLTPELYARTLTAGEPARLGRFLARAERGETLIVGGIGGSITEGASATSQKKRYLNRFSARLAERYPAARFPVVNAGIGASGSLFGSFRAAGDLLGHRPDLILIDYAVNDAADPELALSYEGLLRQCLGAERSPAVVALFMFNEAGENRQEQQLPALRHYGVPALSIRDALWPLMTAGQMTWRDYSPDAVHPNDAGHDFIAQLLMRLLSDIPAVDGVLPSLAGRFNPDCEPYEGAGRILDADGLELIAVEGWTKGPHKAGYTGLQSAAPGSRFTARFTGRQVQIGYQQYKGDFGIAEARIDAGPWQELNGHFSPTRAHGAWAGGHTVLARLGKDLPAGEHTLEVRLTDRRHPDSTGHRFDIGYLLVA